LLFLASSLVVLVATTTFSPGSRQSHKIDPIGYCMQSFYDTVINLTLVVVSVVSWMIGPITKPWQTLNLAIRTPDIADGSHERGRSRLRACYYR